MASDLENTIAHAIKKADRSLFWENYTRQARAVIKALEKDGYRLVPREPSKDQIEAGTQALTYGRTRPSELLRDLYEAMVDKAK